MTSANLSQTLNNPFPDSFENFGTSVALFGNLALVGTPQNDIDDTGQAGSAYLFDPLTGELLQTFDNPDPIPVDRFGISVALSEDLVLVGSQRDNPTYVFDAEGNLLQTLINPISSPAIARFGEAVALSGNLALVAASRESVDAVSDGLVYVFNTTTGEIVQTLNNPSPEGGDTFGGSVAFSSNLALIGAPFDNPNDINNAGTAYLFDTTTGELLQTFDNPTPETGDDFGTSVALSGNFALVGAEGDDAAYLFNTTTGALLQTFDNPTPGGVDLFGNSVALSGNFALVSARQDDSNAGFNTGAAYLFDITTGELLQTIDNPFPDGADIFGSAVALSEDFALVGALNDDPDDITNAGSAYLYSLVDVPEVVINATDSEAAEEETDPGQFTLTLSEAATEDITVTYTVTGTATEGEDYTSLSGSATIVTGELSTTIEVAPLEDDVLEGDETVVVTLTDGDDYNLGNEIEATVTITDNDTVTEPIIPEVAIAANDSNVPEEETDGIQFTLTLSEVATEDITVTYTVTGTATAGEDYTSLSGSATIIAGATSTTIEVAPLEDDVLEGDETVVVALADGDNYNLGNEIEATVTITDNDSDQDPNRTATLSQTLNNPFPENGDQFGTSVALFGNLALIGAFRDNANNMFDVGAAYLFDANNGELLQTLNNPSPRPAGFFGRSVALSNNIALVGASRNNPDGTFADVGAAYSFDINTGELLQTFRNPSPSGLDEFGDSVALSGNLALIGALGEEGSVFNREGAAYLFNTTTGELLQTFNNPSPDTNDDFGTSVALSGNLALVGTPGEDSDFFNVGISYLFDTSTGELLHTLNNPFPDASDEFGSSVALSDNLALVGAPNDNGSEDFSNRPGVAYLFDTTTGELLQTLNHPFPESNNDQFGSSVALSGNLALVGARQGRLQDDSDDIVRVGTAYLFDTTTGELIQTIVNPFPDGGDEFGNAVALSEDFAFIGDPEGDVVGSTYIYTLENTIIPEVIIAANDSNVPEGETDGIQFTFTLSEVATEDITVTYTVTGNATAGEDYTSLSGSATIIAGATSTTIDVSPVDDNLAEGDETVIVTLADGDDYNLGEDTEATITITDNDSDPTDPDPIDPDPTDPLGLNPDESDEEDGIVALQSGLTLNFSTTTNNTSFVNELVVFQVADTDGGVTDSTGTVLTPEDDGYLQAILDADTTEVVLSTLNSNDNLPDAFNSQLAGLEGELIIEEDGALLGFMLVVDGTLDDLEAGQNRTTFLATQNGADLSNVTENGFTLAFSDDNDGVTDNLIFEATIAPTDTLINLGDSEEVIDIGRTVQLQGNDTSVEAIDLVNFDFDSDGDGVADDLTGQSLNVSITLFREAGFDNLIGFFTADATTGAVNGILPTAANRLDYAEAAFNNRIAEFNPPPNESSVDITLTLEPDNLILPFIISNDSTPNGNFSNIYFPFLGVNSDGVDHIRLLGQGVFGFEDLPGGGDQDFDDIIAQITDVALA